MDAPASKTADTLSAELKVIHARYFSSFLAAAASMQLAATLWIGAGHDLNGLLFWVGGPLLIVAGFVLSRQKKISLLESYGLKCRQCQKTPGYAAAGVLAFKSGFCPYCQLKYDSLMELQGNPI
ncbi:MAG TPA: hypothetical protein VMH83_14685 [Candidatus Acidoferrum sp.]|nr:hypothetical protein [Candidatus Acidoferrum sp.]